MYRTGLLAVGHPGIPVVVVGNFTVGGTGKTPLVAWLAARLLEAGRRPGIVLRGYGGRQRAPRLVRPDDDPDLVGDEAVLHARRTPCPVAIGASRLAAAKLLAEEQCDIVIADDGLQHQRLGRDLEIIVIDGARGFGNGAMLPAGPLRERPALRQRPEVAVVVNGEDLHGVSAAAGAVSMHLEARALRQVDDDEPVPPEQLRGTTVHALAGIGHPQRFFALLRRMGANLVEHPRPDHCHYSAPDLAFAGAHPVVMTEKDAVKCRGFAGGRKDLFYLPVEAVLSGTDGARLLERVLAAGRV
jgi:tetraacyldisaccharide 4'-kinase